MSSGVDWRYRITNANPTDPPIRFYVGRGWASGEKSTFSISNPIGLEAVQMAYSQIPGLDGRRQWWLRKAAMCGGRKIANRASGMLLSKAAISAGKRAPHWALAYRRDTVADWIRSDGFVCGEQIAAFAGVALDAQFLDHWESLALAAEEWPREQWSIIHKVEDISITHFFDRTHTPVGQEQADRLVMLLKAWSNSADDRKTQERLCDDLRDVAKEPVLA